MELHIKDWNSLEAASSRRRKLLPFLSGETAHGREKQLYSEQVRPRR